MVERETTNVCLDEQQNERDVPVVSRGPEPNQWLELAHVVKDR